MDDQYDYGQSNGYNQPNNGYGQPNNGYSQPNNGYGQPSNGYGQPNAYYQQNDYSQPNAYLQPSGVQPPVTPSSILTWGILGLAFSSTGILGLIFSIIAKRKAREYASYVGELHGQAKVGNILAKVGFPISIVMIVVWVIYIAVIAGMILRY